MLKVTKTDNGYFTKEGWGVRVMGREIIDYFEGKYSVSFDFSFNEKTNRWLFLIGYAHWNAPRDKESISLEKQQEIFERMRQILPVIWEGNIVVGADKDFS